MDKGDMIQVAIELMMGLVYVEQVLDFVTLTDLYFGFCDIGFIQ